MLKKSTVRGPQTTANAVKSIDSSKRKTRNMKLITRNP